MAHEWGYDGVHGPEHWHQTYSAAGGKCQSPIDINSDKLKIAYQTNQLKLMYLIPNEINVLRNSGHSWTVEGAANVDSQINGGPLLCNYKLVQIHAHWGENDFEGSEHTFNGKHQAAELHMVHVNSTYSSMEEALKHPDGLCVIATLLKVGKPHSEIQKIVNKLPNIMHKGDQTTLDDFVNPKLFLPSNLAYWTYMGSLTTPPCFECVVWIVFDEPIEISKEQLQAFRALRCHQIDSSEHKCMELTCGDKMLRNWRPGFKLGDRVILHSPTNNAQVGLIEKQ